MIQSKFNLTLKKNYCFNFVFLKLIDPGQFLDQIVGKSRFDNPVDNLS
jgi:hypothetical protein